MDGCPSRWLFRGFHCRLYFRLKKNGEWSNVIWFAFTLELCTADYLGTADAAGLTLLHNTLRTRNGERLRLSDRLMWIRAVYYGVRRMGRIPPATVWFGCSRVFVFLIPHSQFARLKVGEVVVLIYWSFSEHSRLLCVVLLASLGIRFLTLTGTGFVFGCTQDVIMLLFSLIPCLTSSDRFASFAI
jgi:hypothetical protein